MLYMLQNACAPRCLLSVRASCLGSMATYNHTCTELPSITLGQKLLSRAGNVSLCVGRAAGGAGCPSR